MLWHLDESAFKEYRIHKNQFSFKMNRLCENALTTTVN
jgi:hypothetical protein